MPGFHPGGIGSIPFAHTEDITMKFVINDNVVTDKTISLGVTDFERYSWELEANQSGADAKTHLTVILEDRGVGIMPKQVVEVFSLPEDKILLDALSVIPELYKLAWHITREQISQKEAIKMWFGSVIQP